MVIKGQLSADFDSDSPPEVGGVLGMSRVKVYAEKFGLESCGTLEIDEF